MRRRGCVMVIIVLVFILGVMASPFLLRGYTSARYADAIYTVDQVPGHSVALVFGARVYSNGRLSAMLGDRVRAAVDLYQSGKVEVLVMSGTRDGAYNEPDAMRQFAISMGVPEEAIVVDYAGFRTYDTCYRARDIFAVDRAILVTQDFHLDRALMLCNTLGVDSVGVAADYVRPQGYSERSLGWSTTREIPATMVAAVDLILRPEPTLGDPSPIVLEQIEPLSR